MGEKCVSSKRRDCEHWHLDVRCNDMKQRGSRQHDVTEFLNEGEEWTMMRLEAGKNRVMDPDRAVLEVTASSMGL